MHRPTRTMPRPTTAAALQVTAPIRLIRLPIQWPRKCPLWPNTLRAIRPHTTTDQIVPVRTRRRIPRACSVIRPTLHCRADPSTIQTGKLLRTVMATKALTRTASSRKSRRRSPAPATVAQDRHLLMAIYREGRLKKFEDMHLRP